MHRSSLYIKIKLSVLSLLSRLDALVSSTTIVDASCKCSQQSVVKVHCEICGLSQVFSEATSEKSKYGSEIEKRPLEANIATNK